MIVYCQRQPKGWRTNKNEGFVAIVVEQKARVVLRIWGMLVLDALRDLYNQKGNHTQFYKLGMSSQLQILEVKKLFKGHVKLLLGEWLLGGDQVLPRRAGRIKKPSVTELDHHGMAACLTKCD